jgi:hypothetical protein
LKTFILNDLSSFRALAGHRAEDLAKLPDLLIGFGRRPRPSTQPSKPTATPPADVSSETSETEQPD